MLRPHEIGGGTVRRPFQMGGERVMPGRTLTAPEILAMPPVNRNALIDKHFITVFPPAPAAQATAGAQRFLVARGFGRYDVIEGRKVNAEPLLDKAAAQALVDQAGGGEVAQARPRRVRNRKPAPTEN